MNRLLAIPCLAVLLALNAGTAGASLIGDTVDIEMFTTTIAAPPPGQTAVVGAGVEFSFFGGDILVDISESDIWLTIPTVAGGVFTNNPAHVVTYVLTDLDWVDEAGEIVGVDIILNTFNTVTVAFTPHSVSIAINEQNLSFEELHIRLITSHGVIPEPATMTLLGIGLAGFALRRRKMKA